MAGRERSYDGAAAVRAEAQTGVEGANRSSKHGADFESGAADVCREAREHYGVWSHLGVAPVAAQPDRDRRRTGILRLARISSGSRILDDSAWPARPFLRVRARQAAQAQVKFVVGAAAPAKGRLNMLPALLDGNPGPTY